MVKNVIWDTNEILIRNTIDSSDIFDFANALHVVCSVRGYKNVTLNFSNAYPVRETFMVPAISLIRDYRRNKCDFELILPDNQSAKNIFHNANWAYLIDDSSHSESTFSGDTHLPATTYKSPDEQYQAVDRIMSMILKAASLERSQIKALEWAINEITDNVTNHSESILGGIIQASTINLSERLMIEFVVADAGIGISQSLNIKPDVIAVERAVQEGVTKNNQTNQGNGLYGSFRIATLSNGRFELHSGRASLIVEGNDRATSPKKNKCLFPGTAVVCRIACDDEKLIENALIFKGKTYQPGFDYIEKRYESGKTNEFTLNLAKEFNSFGSREAGVAARNVIENLLKAHPDYPVVLDFEGVGIVSSSFADEVFGRLFAALGPTAFMSRITLSNIDSTVRAIIDRSISMRLSQTMLTDTNE